MTKHATREEWYLSEEIKTGEKTMTCPVSGREFVVTRWASRGDSVVALEKTPVEESVATDGGSELGVPCDVDDCEARIVGLEDGWEMARGIVCQDCIDYHDRHGHWPDESVDICAECRIDDGMVPHECEESAADRVLIEPGSSCDYCGFEAAMTDGGQPADSGRAVKQCPYAGCDWRTEFDADSTASEITAEVDAEVHWEREHGGQVPDSAEFGDNQCPQCDALNGFNGTTSCSECGHIPVEVRA